MEGRKRVDTLPIATAGYDAVAGGRRKSCKRARNRMDDAYDDPEFERFHERRKRIKYHRYHCRLLRRVRVGPMKARRSELKTLSDVIGDENDLAELITGRRSELQRQGRALGERLFAEHPDKLVDRIGSYWDAAHEYDPDP